MATNNIINSPLAGQTGTVNFAGSNSPTFITPAIGASSATQLTFSSTSEIIGTTTNDDADAGTVGELNFDAVSGQSPASGVITDLTSISLPAGDYIAYGSFAMNVGNTSTLLSFTSWISDTSVTQPDESLLTRWYGPVSGTNYGSIRFELPAMHLSLAGTTTIYISCLITFTAPDVAGGFGNLYIRRIR